MACHSSATYFHSNELNHLSSRDFWKQTIIICATYKTKKPWNVFVRSFMSHAHKFQEFLWSLLFVKFNYHSQRLERRVWCINLVLHLKFFIFILEFQSLGKGTKNCQWMSWKRILCQKANSFAAWNLHFKMTKTPYLSIK